MKLDLMCNSSQNPSEKSKSDSLGLGVENKALCWSDLEDYGLDPVASKDIEVQSSESISVSAVASIDVTTGYYKRRQKS